MLPSDWGRNPGAGNAPQQLGSNSYIIYHSKFIIPIVLDLDKRSITYLPGVGPRRAEILQKEAGIASFEDLLFYFPYKYIDRSRFYKVSEVTGSMPYIQMKGRILYFDELGEGRTRRLVGKFSDGTGTLDLVWFKGLTPWSRERKSPPA